ncbi:MAG: flagellar motor switch protein FliN [Pseudomonadota bacterium]|nr:flagellar motor switch protein FliN [Pseudomonadota bacterium]|tara:strand:- start:166 stop:576 length:411 start_codon:yes stop_codon:yes gene_type:complete
MAEEKDLELNELEDAETVPPTDDDQQAEVTKNGDENVEETSLEAQDLQDIDLPRSAEYLEAVYDIPVQVSAVLGKTTMQVSQLLKLGRGAVIELDRKVGEAIDIYVNNRLVARGEVVVVEDRLGVTMTEIIKTDLQ